MAIEYSNGKIFFKEVEAAPGTFNLVVGVEGSHSIPEDYVPLLRKKLAPLQGIKAHAASMPEDKDSIEYIAMEAMKGKKFELIAVVSPQGKLLHRILGACGMSTEVVEAYRAIKNFERPGFFDGTMPKAIEDVFESAEGFPSIDIGRAVSNYENIQKYVEGGQAAMNLFCAACEDYINSVWQYAIMMPDLMAFAHQGRVGAIVENEHAEAAAKVLSGNTVAKPEQWQLYLAGKGSVEQQAVSSVQKIIFEGPPKRRGITEKIKRLFV